MAERFLDLYEKPLPEKPVWISHGVLPKSGIMLIGGPAKIGKTFLLLDMAHSLAAGGKLWGSHVSIVEPTTVLYVEQEVGEHGLQNRVKMRYDTLGEKPPEGLYFLCKERDMALDSPHGHAILSREIKATGARVVIIDPISRCMMGDENDNTQVAKVFRNLDDLMVSYDDLSFVIAHHFSKPPRDEEESGYDPLNPYNFRGASNFFGMPDTLLTLQRRQGMKSGEWWRLKTGWEMRQAENITGVTLIIGEGGIVTPVMVDAKLVRTPRSLPAAGNPQGWG